MAYIPKAVREHRADVRAIQAAGHDIESVRKLFKTQHNVDLNRTPKGWRFYTCLGRTGKNEFGGFSIRDAILWVDLPQLLYYLEEPQRIVRELKDMQERLHCEPTETCFRS